MVEVFNVAVTTTINRKIRHVKDHLVLHGCIRRGSTEENEYEKKKFKKGFHFTNKLLEKIGLQFLRATVHSDEVFNTETESHAEGDATENVFDTNFGSWMSIISKAMETVERMNGFHPPSQVPSSILAQADSQTGRILWRKIKRLKLNKREVPFEKYLRFKTLFAGDTIWAQKS